MQTKQNVYSILRSMATVSLLTGVFLIAAVNGSSQAATMVEGNVVSVRDVYGMPGQQVTVYVDLDNEALIQAAGFDLVLPPVLTVSSSFDLTGRKQDHILVWNALGDNTYRFIIYSSTHAPFWGNSGSIMQFTCLVGATTGISAIDIHSAKVVNDAFIDVLTGTQDAVVNIYTAPAKVRIKTWLEGFHALGYLRTDIRTANELPWTSPYPEAVRTATSLPANIADWILLELRATATGPPLQQQSYLLKNDGFLCEMDGSTTTLTLNMPPGTYWLVLRHRNHAAVMSATAQTLNSVTAVYYDFILGPGQFYGGGGKSLGGGYYAMPSGDISGEGLLTTVDYVAWYHRVHALPGPGYHDEDLNGDRLVNNTDYTLWLNNARLGWDSRVP